MGGVRGGSCPHSPIGVRTGLAGSDVNSYGSMTKPIAICTICARGGSKGIRNKNLLDLGGKPLLAHSLIQAREAGIFATIAVSSDSPEILDAAKTFGADATVVRPPELGNDAAPKIPAILHCVREIERRHGVRYDIVVDLDATAPLRSPEDIRACVKIVCESDAENLITGVPSRKSPYFNLVELDDRGFARLSKSPASPVFRRQDAPATYDMNASIYVWKRDILESDSPLWRTRTAFYPMPEDAIDIDTPRDLVMVRMAMESQ